ncbi:MAG: hypothetical protein EXX96DRAFT_472886 [Benjaminiella poitrasii]|nr:MAG: hypothetical protein EXX96DRAFT_472886 [Benjaminiella poitrasii]
MPAERIFILGGTGGIGKKVVNDLLDKNIAVTLYARSSEKVNSLFTYHNNSKELISVVQGDYNDLSPVKEGIKGHTRLFLLVADFSSFVKTKKTIAEYAYAAGVKQIVDISSFTVNMGWRESFIGSNHYHAEKAIFDIPNRGYFVALRPGRFMSNIFNMGRPISDGVIFDTADPNKPQGWISPNDIGAVAAVVLSEDIEKHGDIVYGLTGELVTSQECAKIISRISGRDIPYVQVSAIEKYKKIMESGYVSHVLAVDFVDNLGKGDPTSISFCIEILLGRKPETLEEYLQANKALLL